MIYMDISEMRLICQPRPKSEMSWSEKINRKYSIYLTKIFLKLNFSANFVSMMGGLSLIIGSILLHISNLFFSFLYVGIGYYLYILFDTCDGEIARYNQSASLNGLFIDRLSGIISESIFFVSIGYKISLLMNFDLLLLISLSIIPLISRAIYSGLYATILDGINKPSNTLGIVEKNTEITKPKFLLTTEDLSVDSKSNFLKSFIWFMITGIGKPISLILIAFTSLIDQFLFELSLLLFFTIIISAYFVYTFFLILSSLFSSTISWEIEKINSRFN